MYKLADWGKMEAAGAIFLPATGTRGLFSVLDAPQAIHGGIAAQYWSSTNYSSTHAYSFRFENGDPSNPVTVKVRDDAKDGGCAVRLFKEVQ
jgi:hypothetical protein